MGLPQRFYRFDTEDGARNFKKLQGASNENNISRKYLIPKFGFVTPLFDRPTKPQGRSKRLYTTRPFFASFDSQPDSVTLHGIQVTKAVPGELVILCKGRNRGGFYICEECGTHLTQREPVHKMLSGKDCKHTLKQFSLGHELSTSVVRLQFSGLKDEWDSYSVGYALLMGAAEALQVQIPT